MKYHPANRRLCIVDFACGSGALTLPLAYLFPNHDFIGVDMKEKPILILNQRAKECNLTNIHGIRGYIEQYRCHPFDIALGLHACGSATDSIMEIAFVHQAAYIVSPCCVGKVKFSIAGGSSYGFTSFHEEGVEPLFTITHPRSRWLGDRVPSEELYR